jgi:hypothetical protein
VLENWRFRPATINGAPVASRQDVHFHFPSSSPNENAVPEFPERHSYASVSENNYSPAGAAARRCPFFAPFTSSSFTT